ncbi:MAG TPA: VWA-like domain-containing protein [Nitrospiraceae bacterium]
MKTTVTADAAVRLMLFHPFWSELYYSMKIIEDETPLRGRPMTLATDGESMWVSPTFWKTLALDHKISALAHEVCHKMFLHTSRRGDRDPFIWNIACDHSVNNTLESNGFKPIPGYWVCDHKYKGWSPEAIYADIIRNLPPPPPKGGKGKGKPQPGDGEGEPGGSPYEDMDEVPEQWKKAWRDIMQKKGTPQEIERFEAEVQQAVEKAMATARAMGHAPAGVEAPMAEAFKPAEEPWYNHLHRFFQHLCTSEYNWAKIDRRFAAMYSIVAPAHFSEALGEVLIFIDCSGSCYDAAQQAGFATHVSAILSEAKPRKLTVAYFDTKVHFSEEVDPGEFAVQLHPHGGGGTSFADLFDWAEEQGIQPAVCLILTDMEGSFPKHGPEYPVIWADVYHHCGPAPFGETIRVKP